MTRCIKLSIDYWFELKNSPLKSNIKYYIHFSISPVV